MTPRLPLLRRSLCAALIALAPAAAAQAQGAGSVPVTTDPVQIGPVPVEILANGIVAAESVVTVRTRVDGQITQVHVTEGQMVQRGQPLFTLDSRQGLALLAEREAQLSRNRALMARFQADMQRYQSLRGEGFAAQQRFEQAQAEALAAAANVRADEAVVQQIKLNLEFANIVAEADGRLGSLPLRVGNFVRQAENTALATITQVDPILVNFAVPERWLAEIKAAMARGAPRVRALPDQDSAPPAEGELVFVDSAVDTQTGTILLKARFPNRDLRLWPGQYVEVSMAPRVDERATTVAAAAVQTGQQGRFLFVMTQDGTARRRPVELVRSVGLRAVVQGELAEGEKVIVDGAQRVTEGTRVVERNPPPAPQRVSAR
ncbi:efflux RND transporter periplasmic adaptor subunit [Roseicella aerolata]|uniref:Efflux RND transporter periplasmic adaptor subunit n=1 Tax=Roseicella aerolata TaxID=2883479 RepID=A0A9X1IAJ8_9PROT|nr:efflux RND transporter periplasmic adaptor subunit [Roseicella aerolata]MCB4820862.1 efflux RND transporter periplasmic adaptor subunit [Roseicella aerolata]